jgi:hypothetical protein
MTSVTRELQVSYAALLNSKNKLAQFKIKREERQRKIRKEIKRPR